MKQPQSSGAPVTKPRTGLGVKYLHYWSMGHGMVKEGVSDVL